MSRPTVSVIVPCYRQAHYLPDALHSIESQSRHDWECLIVDDGSPDNTREVAQSWEQRDARFRYVHKSNGGLSSARNAGLARAQGDFVQFLDADDVIGPEKLAVQLGVLEGAPPLTHAYCDYHFVTPDTLDIQATPWYLAPRLNSTELARTVIQDWETRLSIPIHCYLFDSRLFRNYHVRFDETLPNHEDFDMLLAALAVGSSLQYVNEKLAHYRLNPNGMTSAANAVGMLRGFLAAIQKQRFRFADSPELLEALTAKRDETRLRIYSLTRWSRARYRLEGLAARIAKRFLPKHAISVLQRMRAES